MLKSGEINIFESMKSVPSISCISRPLRILIFIFCLNSPLFTLAQQKDAGFKISPILLNEINSGKISGRSSFRITVLRNKTPKVISDEKFRAVKVYDSELFSVYSVSATVEELRSEILPLAEITFIENAKRVPVEELQVGNLDLSANKINLAHRKYSPWNGDGIVVSVKENKPDTTDIDFKGRFLATNLSSANFNSHATIMSTMIAGGGNSWHQGRGVAWGSTISSSSFATLMPDNNSAYLQYNISVQNHSYGVGVENFYGADAAAYDASAISNPSLVHIFSSGNSGNLSSSTGEYAGLTGFANLTGSFKMAKNIITVSATDSFGMVASLSSKGPAHDGRVKPELVAFGEDGSSGAAALVSGTALLIQHGYKLLTGSLPSNALVKAILINSADDVGNPEVDYSNGFGNLNAANALKTLQRGRFMNGTVTNGNTQTFSISIPDGIKKLKITLVWNDPPAAPNASKALINDLDLELLNASTSDTWKPWVLNKFPNIDSLQQLATRKKDSLNNIEQITLENPASGNYQFKVTGFLIQTASQQFFIAYQLDSVDLFEWQRPVETDFIFPSSSNLIRWKSSFSSPTGLLEFSIDNGNNWQLIQNTVNLNSGFYRWNVSALTNSALLRMTIGLNQFVSDTFTIANRTQTGVGFNCPDSFLFYWNKIPSVTNYRVYQLGSHYLEPVAVTSDSIIILSKNTNPSLYYAVAPLIGNKEGVRSYTFNYSNQGVECYIRSFLGSLVNNTAHLDLSLGTLFNINKIILEKYDGNMFNSIQQVTNPNLLTFNFTDVSLKKGLNIYRVKLELFGGKSIYSLPETVYYFENSDYIIYPNPVQQNQTIHILNAGSFLNTLLLVYNMQGEKLIEMKADDLSNSIQAGRLSKGIYFFRFIRYGEKDVVLKVFVK